MILMSPANQQLLACGARNYQQEQTQEDVSDNVPWLWMCDGQKKKYGVSRCRWSLGYLGLGSRTEQTTKNNEETNWVIKSVVKDEGSCEGVTFLFFDNAGTEGILSAASRREAPPGGRSGGAVGPHSQTSRPFPVPLPVPGRL